MLLLSFLTSPGPGTRWKCSSVVALRRQAVGMGKSPSTVTLTCQACRRAPGQVGLAEMKPVVDMTGGMVVMTDTFANPVFKESFKRVFAPAGDPGCLDIASNATFEARPPALHACHGLL